MPTIAEKLAANASPKCCVCGKSVYKTEEVRALEKIWHKSCFTCSSTKKDGCGKTLNIMEGYLVHQETIPYCKSCFNKNFAPKGVNSSLAATVQPEQVEPSTTSSNFKFEVDNISNKVQKVTLSDGPPKRRQSAKASMFESPSVEAAAAMARVPASEKVSEPTQTSTASDSMASPSTLPYKERPVRRASTGKAPHSESGSGGDRIAAELAAARDAYAANHGSSVAVSSKLETNNGTEKSTVPVNSVFATAISGATKSPTQAPAPAPAPASASADSPPKRRASAAAMRYQQAASTSGTVADQAPAPAPAPSPSPAPAPAPAPAPTPAPAPAQKEADNVIPTPVVFASAVADEHKRRGSGGPAMNVGGQLKHGLHKEQTAVLDGDEVDEDEWN